MTSEVQYTNEKIIEEFKNIYKRLDEMNKTINNNNDLIIKLMQQIQLKLDLSKPEIQTKQTDEKINHVKMNLSENHEEEKKEEKKKMKKEKEDEKDVEMNKKKEENEDRKIEEKIPSVPSVVSNPPKQMDSIKLRFATFNVENLYARYQFSKYSKKDCKAIKGFTHSDLSGFSIHHATDKKFTGQAIQDVNADIICLQEVESLPVLEKFNKDFLKGMNYHYCILIDGHDPREIDVAILSRFPITHIMTYRHLRNKKNTSYIFSRDCLEVDFDIFGKSLTVYVSHFTSMMKGRDETRHRRIEQSEAVIDIVSKRWEKKNFDGNFIFCGDLNDHDDEKSGLIPLFNFPHWENIMRRLNPEDRWTIFSNKKNSYGQLDYIFLSKRLAEFNKDAKPQIFRKGIPKRAKRYTGERYEGVGDSYPKASDHTPVYVDLIIN